MGGISNAIRVPVSLSVAGTPLGIPLFAMSTSAAPPASARLELEDFNELLVRRHAVKTVLDPH